MTKPLRVRALTEGKLEQFGVRYHRREDGVHVLSDGANELFVLVTEDGSVHSFTLPLRSRGAKIVSALEAAFRLKVVSDKDPRYWGVETDEDLQILLRELEELVQLGLLAPEHVHDAKAIATAVRNWIPGPRTCAQRNALRERVATTTRGREVRCVTQ